MRSRGQLEWACQNDWLNKRRKNDAVHHLDIFNHSESCSELSWGPYVVDVPFWGYAQGPAVRNMIW